MGMQTDVKAVTVTEDGAATTFRSRVKSLVLTSTASAGSVVLKDGGASGVAKLTLNTPASADFHNILIPGEGVLFESGIYVDVTNVSSVTVFHG